jgi:prepilin-type N-terminal cleavage/methylation domain-containing protein/prepilin-type processing-associated H-X9-DG protein
MERCAQLFRQETQYGLQATRGLISMSSGTRRSGFSLIELLVVIAIVAILAGLIAAAAQKARTAATRAQCVNNMRQIGIALKSYITINGKYPSGYSTATNTTWMFAIAPSMEQNHVPNPAFVMRQYTCPSDNRLFQASYENQDGWIGGGGTFNEAFTSYQGVNGTTVLAMDGILYLNSTVRDLDITNGLSNTLLVGERPPSADMLLGWWYNGSGNWIPALGGPSGQGDTTLGVADILTKPQGLPEIDACPVGPYAYAPGSLTNNCDAFHFWSLHDGGGNWTFADGSVRFIPYSAATTLPALAKRASN